MGTVLLVLAAAVFVFVVALRRPEKPRKCRQDPLAFATAATQFGFSQLGTGAFVSYGGADYVVHGSVTYR